MEGEAFRLLAGELLVLRRGNPLEIDRADPAVRLALFQVSPDWVAAFRALHGTEPEEGERANEVVPAGSPLARRAAQLLVGALPVGSEVPARPSATTVAALLEIAFLAQGSPLGPRRARRQAAAQRETLIRGLGDHDPETDGDFSLQGLADRLGLSPRQTARLVRCETGRSFRELKASARLERARKLLASSELSILEVALRAGWTSTSQFHAAFRSNVGVTPARYRAENRG
jgi:AraC-like DNA-binding protein